MAPAQFLSTVLLALASFSTAIPVTGIAYPDVVPGPGFPSLESLGLTSEKLYTMPLSSEVTAALENREAQFDGRCGPDPAYTNVNDVIACFHYLNSIPTQDCGTPDNYRSVEFCRAGAAHITGTTIVSAAQHTQCRNVATAVLYTIDGCTRPDQSVAGYQAAYGNGYLIVGAVNIHYG